MKVMDYKYQGDVLVHELSNPPHKASTCDITLSVLNSTGLLVLTKGTKGYKTSYTLIIPRMMQLGFKGTNDNARDIENLILAFNLNLDNCCVTTSLTHFPEGDISMVRDPSDGLVEEIRTSFSFEGGVSEHLDENAAANTFRKIQNMNRFDLTSATSTKGLQLAKALKSYENAMNATDRLPIFKELFSAIEIATNSDGVPRNGPSLDTEISTLAASPRAEIERWRQFNARVKHIDKSSAEAARYVNGMADLPSFLGKLRKCAKSIINQRL